MRRSTRPIPWLSMLLVLLASGGAVRGAGIVSGTVVDREGGPLEDVQVVLEGEGAKARRYTAETNRKGVFVIRADNGRYFVGIESQQMAVDRVRVRSEDEKRHVVGEDSRRLLPGVPPLPVDVHSRYTIHLELVVADRDDLREEHSQILLGTVSEALEAGDTAKAATMIDRLLQSSPDDALGLTLRAYLHAEEGRLAEAEADLDRALARQPDLLDARYQIGRLYLKTGREQEAKDAFLRVAESDGNEDLRGRAWLSLGELRRDSGDAAGAIEAFEAACAASPSLVGALAPEVAALYSEMGQTEKAEAWLDKARGTASADPAVLFNVAVGHFNAREWDRAIEGFRKVVALDPEFADAYRTLGFALLNVGDRAGAAEALGKFVQLEPEGPASDEARRLLEALGG